MNSKITPVILSGGGGTRLWPLSRTQFPKQYWALFSEHTLLQETAERVSKASLFSGPIIICNEEHRFVVAEQLRQINIQAQHIVLEAQAANTAPAIAMACLLQENSEDLLLVLPADHNIQQPEVFQQVVEEAAPYAEEGHIITFGILPNKPETRYGYIHKGPACTKLSEAQSSIFKVQNFLEKPNLKTAEAFLASQQYYWNSGIFLFSAKTMLAELERLQPELLEACRSSLATSKQDLEFLRLGAYGAQAKTLNISIDHAVMEHTDKALVMPVKMGWSDVGTWDAVWEKSQQDASGNVIIGDVVTQNVKQAYLRTDQQLLSVLGLENIIVVAMQDAILVAHQEYVQEVKEVVHQLQQGKRQELDSHTRVYRPWGHYQNIDKGHRFQVKRLMIKPGGKTSLQIHYHRSEHWVVVEGTAKVRRGEETLIIHENESIYIPMGVQHSVENPGKIPLHFVEVQSGAYLGEDDILRLEDAYGRAESNLNPETKTEILEME